MATASIPASTRLASMLPSLIFDAAGGHGNRRDSIRPGASWTTGSAPRATPSSRAATPSTTSSWTAGSTSFICSIGDASGLRQGEVPDRRRRNSLPGAHEQPSPASTKASGSFPTTKSSISPTSTSSPAGCICFLDRSITGYFATVFHDAGTVQVVTGAASDRSRCGSTSRRIRSHLEAKHGLVVKETLSTVTASA